jgi:hypothetical protein
MTIKAVSADGVAHEFPDGTSQEVIDAAMKSYARSRPVAERPSSPGALGTVADIVEGLYLGARQPLDTAAMRLEQAFPSVSRFGANLGFAPSATNILAEQNILRAQSPAKVSQIVGNVAGVAPFIAAGGGSVAPATFGGSAVTGGATSALLSQAQTPTEFAGETATGVAGGIVGKGVGDFVGGVLAPKVTEGVRTLTDLGVRLTPGAILGAADTAVGRAANMAESALTSIPGLGALISQARGTVPEDFEKAAVTKLADFINVPVPQNLSGDRAVSWVKKGISNKFNDLVPKLDMTLPDNWQNKALDIFDKLDVPLSRKDLLDDFLSTVSRNVEAVADKSGRIAGRNLQNSLSSLSNTARTFIKSDNGFERRIGSGLVQVRSWMLDTLAKQNPAQAEELLRLNKAWNAQTVLDKAVGYQGNVVSPASLTRAVKSMSGGKIGGFFEDLARAGMELPKGLAESGTFTRAAAAQALGLVGAGAGGTYLAQQENAVPYELPVSTLAVLGALYTPPGRKTMQYLMAREAGPKMQQLANMARIGLSPATAAAATTEPVIKPPVQPEPTETDVAQLTDRDRQLQSQLQAAYNAGLASNKSADAILADMARIAQGFNRQINPADIDTVRSAVAGRGPIQVAANPTGKAGAARKR